MDLFRYDLPDLGTRLFFLSWSEESVSIIEVMVVEKHLNAVYARDSNKNEYELLPEEEGNFWFARKEDVQRKIRQHWKGAIHVERLN